MALLPAIDTKAGELTAKTVTVSRLVGGKVIQKTNFGF